LKSTKKGIYSYNFFRNRKAYSEHLAEHQELFRDDTQPNLHAHMQRWEEVEQELKAKLNVKEKTLTEKFIMISKKKMFNANFYSKWI
jgi:hypothetical protein